MGKVAVRIEQVLSWAHFLLGSSKAVVEKGEEAVNAVQQEFEEHVKGEGSGPEGDS